MPPMTSDTLAIILGGGAGSRLFPLTATRSKPAVPIGGKYRLIDVPISNCLHADIRRIYVLTQFNSASLNRHVSNSYRMDYCELVDAHKALRADITIAAQPVDAATATQMGIFRFDRDGSIVAFEEKPKPPRLSEIGRSIPPDSSAFQHDDEKPFMASMGIYVFSRRVVLDLLERDPGHDFGRELIPNALGKYKVMPYLYSGYWADVGTIESFYDANVMLGRAEAPFRFWDPHRAIYTNLRHLPGSRITECTINDSILSEGCFLDRCRIRESVVGIRSHIGAGTQVSRSVLLGADFYEDAPAAGMQPLGIGRDVVLDRTIIDKNARIGDGARLVNEKNVDTADGDGYYIRGGVIVVPKGGIIRPGTVV